VRALIVDDSPTARQQALAALEGAMESLGLTFPVDVAESGVEALRILASAEITLLVLDLHMPDIHGLDVLSFWTQRANKEGTNKEGEPRAGRAVIVSTEVSPRDREKALQSGAWGFVEKPVSSQALQAVLEGLHA
jgi:two-component system, chemotaxis family, chemotaxis protein CheY